MNTFLPRFLIAALLLAAAGYLLKPRPPRSASFNETIAEKGSLYPGTATGSMTPAKFLRPAKGKSSARPFTFDSNPAFAEEMERVMSLPDPDARESALKKLLSDWVAFDAPAAARFARAIKAPELREEIMRCVLQTWAAQDPAGAVQWAAEIPEPAERQFALGNVCAQIAETDPQAAVRLAMSYQLNESQAGFLENLAGRWAEKEFAAACEWAKQQPASERNALLARLAFVQSQIDPAAAATLVVQQIVAGVEQEEAAISVLHQWALRDLDAATAWARRFPEGPLRDRAESELSALAQSKSNRLN